jgi:hypothetical protein
VHLGGALAVHLRDLAQFQRAHRVTPALLPSRGKSSRAAALSCVTASMRER